MLYGLRVERCGTVVVFAVVGFLYKIQLTIPCNLGVADIALRRSNNVRDLLG